MADLPTLDLNLTPPKKKTALPQLDLNIAPPTKEADVPILPARPKTAGESARESILDAGGAPETTPSAQLLDNLLPEQTQKLILKQKAKQSETKIREAATQDYDDTESVESSDSESGETANVSDTDSLPVKVMREGAESKQSMFSWYENAKSASKVGEANLLQATAVAVADKGYSEVESGTWQLLTIPNQAMREVVEAITPSMFEDTAVYQFIHDSLSSGIEFGARQGVLWGDRSAQYKGGELANRFVNDFIKLDEEQNAGGSIPQSLVNVFDSTVADPAGFASFMVEQVARSTPSLLAAAASGGHSALAFFTATLTQTLGTQATSESLKAAYGFDLLTNDGMAGFVRSPSFDVARRKALNYATFISLFELGSFRLSANNRLAQLIATKTAGLNVSSAIGKVATGAASKVAGAAVTAPQQAALAGTGEAVATLASGERVSSQEVALEAMGGGVGDALVESPIAQKGNKTAPKEQSESVEEQVDLTTTIAESMVEVGEAQVKEARTFSKRVNDVVEQGVELNQQFDPVATKNIVNRGVRDSKLGDSMYIAAEALDKFLKSNFKDKAESIASQMGLSREEINEAIHNGDSVELKTTDLIINMIGMDGYKDLLPHLRENLDALTDEEAQDFDVLKSRLDDMIKDSTEALEETWGGKEQAAEVKKESDAIAKDVSAQVLKTAPTKTRVPKEVRDVAQEDADTWGKLIAQRYEARAFRATESGGEYVSPKQLYDEDALRIAIDPTSASKANFGLITNDKGELVSQVSLFENSKAGEMAKGMGGLFHQQLLLDAIDYASETNTQLDDDAKVIIEDAANNITDIRSRAVKKASSVKVGAAKKPVAKEVVAKVVETAKVIDEGVKPEANTLIKPTGDIKTDRVIPDIEGFAARLSKATNADLLGIKYAEGKTLSYNDILSIGKEFFRRGAERQLNGEPIDDAFAAVAETEVLLEHNFLEKAKVNQYEKDIAAFIREEYGDRFSPEELREHMEQFDPQSVAVVVAPTGNEVAELDDSPMGRLKASLVEPSRLEADSLRDELESHFNKSTLKLKESDLANDPKGKALWESYRRARDDANFYSDLADAFDDPEVLANLKGGAEGSKEAFAIKLADKSTNSSNEEVVGFIENMFSDAEVSQEFIDKINKTLLSVHRVDEESDGSIRLAFDGGLGILLPAIKEKEKALQHIIDNPDKYAYGNKKAGNNVSAHRGSKRRAIAFLNKVVKYNKKAKPARLVLTTDNLRVALAPPTQETLVEESQEQPPPITEEQVGDEIANLAADFESTGDPLADALTLGGADKLKKVQEFLAQQKLDARPVATKAVDAVKKVVSKKPEPEPPPAPEANPISTIATDGLAKNDVLNLLSSLSDESLAKIIRDKDTSHPLYDLLAQVQQDRFGEMFEVYLNEGVAPSAKLHQIFNRIASWLVNLYRSITGARPTLSVSKEVKGVLARLLASDFEIEVMSSQNYTTALFRSAKEAGMSDKDYAEYVYRSEIAREEAKARQTAKKLKDDNRERTARFKELMVKNTKAVANMPIYKLLYTITKGELADGTKTKGFDKLNTSEVANAIGKGAMQGIPKVSGKAIYATGKDTASLARAANFFGFKNREELVYALSNAVPFEAALRQSAEARLKEEMQVDAESMAIASIHKTDSYAKLMIMEIQALNVLDAAGVQNQVFVRKLAKDRLGAIKVKDIESYHKLSMDERRHGRNAAAAMQKGDKVLATSEKFLQLVSYYTIRESGKVRDNISTARRKLSKIRDTSKDITIDADFFDAAKSLRRQILLTQPKDDTPRGAVANIRKLIERVEKIRKNTDSENLDIPPSLNSLERPRYYGTMTYDEFMEAYKFIQTMIAQGKRVKSTEIEGKRIIYEEFVVEATASLNKLKDKGLEKRTNNADERSPYWTDRFILSPLAYLNADLTKLLTIFTRADNYDYQGAMNKYIYAPINRANTDQLDMNRDFGTVLETSFAAIPKKRQSDFDKVIKPELLGKLGYVYEEFNTDEETGERTPVESSRKTTRITKANLMMILLNFGNESNAERVIEGEKSIGRYDLTADDVWSVINSVLSKEEIDHAQAIWDFFETLYPYSEALHRYKYGVSPVKVEPRGFVFGEGKNKVSYRGGYFPVAYSKIRTPYLIPHQVMAEITDPASYQHSQSGIVYKVGEGHWVSRQGASPKMPLNLDYATISTITDAHIHNLAYFNVDRMTRKFLTDKDLMALMRKKLGQPQVLAMQAMIQNIVLPPKPVGSWWEKMAMHFKVNATFASLGWSLKTAVAQYAGLFPAFTVLTSEPTMTWGGAANIARLLPYNFVRALFPDSYAGLKLISPFFAHYMEHVDRDISAHVHKLSGKQYRIIGLTWVQEQGYILTALAQLHVNIAIGLTAFEDAQGRQGKSIKESADYMQAMIQGSQGTGFRPHLAKVMASNNAFIQLITMFSTYGSTLYAMSQLAIGRPLDHPDQWRAWLNLGAHIGIAVVMSGVASAMIRHGFPDDDDDESWVEWVMKAAFDESLWMLPGVRDMVNIRFNTDTSVELSYEQFTPATNALNATTRTLANVFELGAAAINPNVDVGDVWRTKMLKDLTVAASGFIKLPSSALNNAFSFFYEPHDFNTNETIWGKILDSTVRN